MTDQSSLRPAVGTVGTEGLLGRQKTQMLLEKHLIFLTSFVLQQTACRDPLLVGDPLLKLSCGRR